MIYVAPNTTFCPDTPENWRRFHFLKDKLLYGVKTSKRPPKRRAERKPIIFYGLNTCKG